MSHQRFYRKIYHNVDTFPTEMIKIRILILVDTLNRVP